MAESTDRILFQLVFGTSNTAAVVGDIRKVESAVASAVRTTKLSSKEIGEHSSKMEAARIAYTKNAELIKSISEDQEKSIDQKKRDIAAINTQNSVLLAAYRQSDSILRGKTMTGQEYRRQLKLIEKQEELTGKAMPTDKINLLNRHVASGGRVTAKMREEMAQWNKEAEKMNSNTETNILTAAKWAFMWFILYRALRLVIDQFNGVFSTTIELNKSMTELAAIADKNREEIDSLLPSYAKLASTFGISIEKVLEGTKDWARQGLDIQQSQEALTATLLLANVAMVDVSTAAKYLTAVYYEYGLTTKQLVNITDKWVKLDMLNATTVQNLAEAYQVTGSAAYEFGVTIDELNALVTAATSITQRSGSEIGRSLRTIFTRLYRPETIDDLYNIGRVSAIALGGMKPLYQILKELADRWNDLTEAQKAQISYSLAGVRQSSHLLALMAHWNLVEKSLKESLTARGEALLRNTIIMQSYSKQIAEVGPKLERLRVALGNIVMPIVTQGIKTVGNILDALSSKFENTGNAADKYYKKVLILAFGSEDYAKQFKNVAEIVGFLENVEKIPGSEKKLLSIYKSLQAQGLVQNLTEEQMKNIEKLGKAIIEGAKAIEKKTEADLKAAAINILQIREMQEAYDVWQKMSLAIKTAEINIKAIEDTLSDEIFSIDKLNSEQETHISLLKGGIAALAGYSLEIQKAYSYESAHKTALEGILEEYKSITEALPELRNQLIYQITHIYDEKTGVDKLREGYIKHKGEIDALIEKYKLTGNVEKDIIGIRLLLAKATSTFGDSQEFATEKITENLDKIGENKKKQQDLTKSILEDSQKQIDAIKKIREQYNDWAESVKGPFMDAFKSMLQVYELTEKGTRKTEDAIKILTREIIEMAEEALINSLLVSINKLTGVFSLLGIGLEAMKDPASYYTAMVQAGTTIEKLWITAFQTGATEVENGIIDGFRIANVGITPTSTSVTSSSLTATKEGITKSVEQAGSQFLDAYARAVADAVNKKILGLSVEEEGEGWTGIDTITDRIDAMNRRQERVIEKLTSVTTWGALGLVIGAAIWKSTEGGIFGALSGVVLNVAVEEFGDKAVELLSDIWEDIGYKLEDIGEYAKPSAIGAAIGAALGSLQGKAGIGMLLGGAVGAGVHAIWPEEGAFTGFIGKVVDRVGKIWTGVNKELAKPFWQMVISLGLMQRQQQLSSEEMQKIEDARAKGEKEVNITQAKTFSYIGTMLGSTLGPVGTILGAFLGEAYGRTQKQIIQLDQIDEDTKSVTKAINAASEISQRQLEVVNRNLAALRELPPPYPLREQYYFRPYEFGEGPFYKSAGMNWGSGKQYANPIGGNNVTVGSIVINVPSGNPQDIINAIEDTFALKSISLYQGG